MSMRGFMAGATGGLVIAFGAGHTGTLQAQTTSTSAAVEQPFIGQMGAGNLLEIRLGQTAEKKASNASVKQFAQRMVVDHTSMQRQWQALALRNRIPFKARLSPQQEEQTGRLAGLSTAEFDRSYMSLMVQNHRDNLNALQNERSRMAHSADVQRLIDQDLLAIQNHLTMAQQTGREVGADVSGGVAITQTDTSILNPPVPGMPRRTDTTVITQNPLPDQNGQDRQKNENRQKDERRDRQGNVKADAEFIRTVDAGNFLQIRLGRLAQQKGRDAEVKRFGKKLEQDYSAFQKQWINMASRNGMKFESGMGPEHRADLELLQKASGGKAFDQAYMTFMIQSNNGYVNYWRKEGRAARSAPVRQLVDAGLPTLEQNLDTAKRIGERVGVDADAALAGRRVAAQR